MDKQSKKIKVIDIVAPEEKEEKLEVKSEKQEIRKEIKEAAIEQQVPEDWTGEMPAVAAKIKENFLGEESRAEKKSGSKLRKYIIIVLFSAVLGGVVYTALEILPRVDIKIIAKKSSWNFNDWLAVSKNISDIDLLLKQIPAEFLSEKRNLTMAFVATGKKQVEKKAGGEIIIYNAYSSQPQTLVKDTRFEAPDGKIFLLSGKIIVPGAIIEEAKIIPSSIKANVVAEKAGEEYNIGSVERFIIPGFKGTPKYSGFYAKSGASMKGGFVGEMAYPTDNDIKNAREKIKIALRENLNIFILSQLSGDFKAIEGSQEFNFLKENIGQDVDKDGNFFASLEGELKIFVFKENDALKLISGLAKQSLGQDFEAKEYKIDYGVGRPDFPNGKMSFTVNYKGTFWQPIDAKAFKNSILKKKESELKIAVFSLQNIEKATISFWPFWVKSVPNDVGKIKTIIE